MALISVNTAQYALLGQAWASPTLVRVSLIVILRAVMIKTEHQALQVWKFSAVSKINHIIWSLDCQRHGKCVTKFSWIAIYGHWIVNVTGHVWQSFPKLPYMIVGLSVLQKYKFTKFYWCTIIHNKVWALKEVEKHCFDDAENCIGNEKKRNTRREGNQISQKKGILQASQYCSKGRSAQSRGHHIKYIHLHQMHVLILITAQPIVSMYGWSKYSNIALTMCTFKNSVDSIAIH